MFAVELFNYSLMLNLFDILLKFIYWISNKPNTEGCKSYSSLLLYATRKMIGFFIPHVLLVMIAPISFSGCPKIIV